MVRRPMLTLLVGVLLFLAGCVFVPARPGVGWVPGHWAGPGVWVPGHYR